MVKKLAKWEKYLKRIFYDVSHPAAFASLSKLVKIVREEKKYKISLKKIKSFLLKQDIFSLQKQPRNKFTRRKIIVPYKNYMIEADVGFLPKYEKDNDNYKYILLTIEAMSRYIQVKPLFTKNAKEVGERLLEILDFYSEKGPIYILRTDPGGEFENKMLSLKLAGRNIKQVITDQTQKASLAERSLKEFKKRLYSHMSAKHSTKWVNVLQKAVIGHNKSFNRSIKTNPKNAWLNMTNAELWLTQYSLGKKDKKPHLLRIPKASSKYYAKYKIGHLVRISGYRLAFQKFTDEKWTNEIFCIIDIKHYGDHFMYKLKDHENKIIKGLLYEYEITLTNIGKEHNYEIDEILSHRVRNKKKETLVRFIGHKNSPTWVSNNSIVNIGPKNKQTVLSDIKLSIKRKEKKS
jgi:hypothetical protein